MLSALSLSALSLLSLSLSFPLSLFLFSVMFYLAPLGANILSLEEVPIIL